MPSLEVVSVGGKGLFQAYQKVLDACHVAWVVVADLDYIEQVGIKEIKGLFTLNAAEIKVDVIDNIKSLDGAALANQIEKAMSSGDWSDAQNLWAYIKSRRIRLRPGLKADEEANLHAFILQKETEDVFILSRGALEAYLPVGYASKDMDALIALVNADDFWDRLPLEPRSDLERIAKRLLGVAGQA